MDLTQKLENELKKLQTTLENITNEVKNKKFTGTSKNDTVKITLDGNLNVEQLTIDKSKLPLYGIPASTIETVKLDALENAIKEALAQAQNRATKDVDHYLQDSLGPVA
jgi:DNA-binding protein YbaB